MISFRMDRLWEKKVHWVLRRLWHRNLRLAGTGIKLWYMEASMQGDHVGRVVLVGWVQKAKFCLTMIVQMVALRKRPTSLPTSHSRCNDFSLCVCLMVLSQPTVKLMEPYPKRQAHRQEMASNGSQRTSGSPLQGQLPRK